MPLSPYSGSPPDSTPEVDVYVEPDATRVFIALLQDGDGAGGFTGADLSGAAVELELAPAGEEAALLLTLAGGTIEVEADMEVEQGGVTYTGPGVYALFTEEQLEDRRGFVAGYYLRTIRPGEDAPVYRCTGQMHFNARRPDL